MLNAPLEPRAYQVAIMTIVNMPTDSARYRGTTARNALRPCACRSRRSACAKRSTWKLSDPSIKTSRIPPSPSCTTRRTLFDSRAIVSPSSATSLLTFLKTIAYTRTRHPSASIATEPVMYITAAPKTKTRMKELIITSVGRMTLNITTLVLVVIALTTSDVFV